MRTLSERRLLVATHNAGKLDEMRALFAPHGIEVVGAAEMGLAEPEETETSFVGNARIKAAAAVKAREVIGSRRLRAAPPFANAAAPATSSFPFPPTSASPRAKS